MVEEESEGVAENRVSCRDRGLGDLRQEATHQHQYAGREMLHEEVMEPDDSHQRADEVERLLQVHALDVVLDPVAQGLLERGCDGVQGLSLSALRLLSEVSDILDEVSGENCVHLRLLLGT